MSNPEAECEPNHQNTLECTKEFSGNYNYNAPYLAIASSHQDPTLAKDLTPTNISSASTSRFAEGNRNRRAESHHRSLVGKVSSAINGASKMEKGKEPIIYEADDSESSSNRREDGQENFECISNRGIVSPAKRERISDSESEKISKRLKGLHGGGCSFMNWVASITNGLNRTHDGALEAFRHPSGDAKGVIYPRDIGISHGTMGFGSIFQALCNTENSVRSNKIKYIDHQKEIYALKGTEGEKGSNVASCVLQHSSFPTSSFKFGDGGKEKVSIGPIAIGAHGTAPPKNNLELNDKVSAPIKRLVKEISQVESSSLAAIDSSAELTPDRSRFAFQNSLWIARLSPGVSSPQLESIQCPNYLDLSAQHKIPFWKLKNMRFSEKPQHNSASHTDSVRIVTENYESKLLTVSSKCCKRSKLTASSFVQKLDAFKHNKFLKVSVENPSRNKKILFCGMIDHSIMECSEVAETKLDQFQMKSISFYDTFKKTRKNNENQQKDHLQVLHGSTVSEKENGAIETEIVVCKEIRSRANESAVGRDAKDLVEDPLTSSFSLENGLKKSEFKSFCSRSKSAVMEEPKGMFVAVRKLRLSRMDVLRWMKSRGSHYNLGGFFLRLRIGKLERGLRGTGYHVACINDASCQSSINVRVGSATYSVTSPFISNDDFNEDELMAWWFQNLRDGTKMPSYEELNEKFQFRLKFGL